jgi:transposase InsO family protein
MRRGYRSFNSPAIILNSVGIPLLSELFRHRKGTRCVPYWARCTVERLMRQQGLQGVVRGKTVKTTISSPDEAYLLDRVNRQFTAARPNAYG